MHEFSLAQGLMQQLKDLAKQHDVQKICTVRVDIGTRSGIVVDSFSFGFEVMAKENVLDEILGGILQPTSQQSDIQRLERMYEPHIQEVLIFGECRARLSLADPHYRNRGLSISELQSLLNYWHVTRRDRHPNMIIISIVNHQFGHYFTN